MIRQAQGVPLPPIQLLEFFKADNKWADSGENDYRL